MKRLVTLAAALWSLTGSAHAADGDVVVAFRVDAAPFSAKGDDGFEGFIANLCEQAVPRAGYRIDERVGVTAGDRLTSDVDLARDRRR